jgi:hypothetical protein
MTQNPATRPAAPPSITARALLLGERIDTAGLDRAAGLSGRPARLCRFISFWRCGFIWPVATGGG